MIPLEVSINGERICLAGDEAIVVLNATLTVGRKQIAKEMPLPDAEMGEPFFHVGGMRLHQGEEPTHVRWAESTKVEIGDVVELRFIEAKEGETDLPTTVPSRHKNNERRRFESAKATYFDLKQKYEPDST